MRNATDEITKFKLTVEKRNEELCKTEGELNEMQIQDDEKNRIISELKNKNAVLKEDGVKLYKGNMNRLSEYTVIKAHTLLQKWMSGRTQLMYMKR